ncbi:hypothetical protein RhiXN_07783 [Rhizoctonia solani]|uniref:Uncharacterized protein n=1 Tax=Rhizoctonia solani TaxID=456999 RepID=A0A8H8P1S0_9AGAM|nr:uncharacterized protein RhiXN_07783 [Rhizoctonia solani]QRW22747.1 hypothetical protein RhiXN_07783 [Rhizoctonia solani]
MGSVCSAIGRAINSVISAIAHVFMAIVGASSYPSGISSSISSAADAALAVGLEGVQERGRISQRASEQT